MPSTAQVGDRVKVVNTYLASDRHLNGREGTVETVLPSTGVGRTGYRVKLDTGQLVLTYSVTPASFSPAASTDIVVDVKRAQAFVVAKDALPADALVSDIVEAARFILGDPEPSTVSNTVHLIPGSLSVGTLAPATDIDADRRTFNEGFNQSGVEVHRDQAGDNDLVRVSTSSGGTEYLEPFEVEALIRFLQTAVRVGNQDGTRPPFPEPSGTTPF